MKLPIKEIAKSIPGLIGIRLEEEPKHQVLNHDGDFQIRRYEPIIVAKVDLAEKDRERAVDQAFEILANYIFGENRAKETLSMTTPVLQQETENGWSVAFVLPSHLSMNTAPVPIDPRVKIESVPAQTRAVYRYNGNNSNAASEEATERLRRWLNKKNLKETGEFRIAQYDQPFALPIFKRNEAMVQLLQS